MNLQDMKKLAGLNEASVNISLNGTNSQEIKDLMGIFTGGDKPPMGLDKPALPPIGLDKPEPAPPIGLDLPDIKPPIGPALAPDLDGMPPKPLDLDGPSSCDTCGGIHGDEPCGEAEGDWDNSPEEKYQDGDFLRKSVSGGPKNKKSDIRVKDPMAMESKFKDELWKALNEKYSSEITSEEQTFSGRNDRTYFIVPNDDDYMDIQDDNRFAGDIEVPDENADIMALPNSKFRKLKRMYGNKVLDLGTDYDEAVEREEKKAKRRHLANISRTKAGGSAGRRIEGEQTADEGNAFVHAVRKAKMDGKKKGDKIPHPDPKAKDDEIVISGEQAAREKELKGKQHKLPPHLKKKIEDAPEDQLNTSQYDEEMDDIRKLSGL